MLSEGQRQALEDLQRIADAGDSIEISYKEVSNSDLGWPVLVSIDTGFPSSEGGGIPLRSREIIFIFMPEEFPWEIPMVCVAHGRWAGHRHVNWGVLCLYLAPDIEWNPSDGMHGFMERLVEWLTRAAQDTLAPVAAPVHPPVVLESKDLPTVVPTVNTPIPEDEPWLGFVAVEKPADRMVKLSKWIPLAGEWKGVDIYKAAVVLSHLPFPYDFPDSLDGLLSELDKHGLPLKHSRGALDKGSKLTTLRCLRAARNLSGTHLRGSDAKEYVQTVRQDHGTYAAHYEHLCEKLSKELALIEKGLDETPTRPSEEGE